MRISWKIFSINVCFCIWNCFFFFWIFVLLAFVWLLSIHAIVKITQNKNKTRVKKKLVKIGNEWVTRSNDMCLFYFDLFMYFCQAFFNSQLSISTTQFTLSRWLICWLRRTKCYCTNIFKMHSLFTIILSMNLPSIIRCDFQFVLQFRSSWVVLFSLWNLFCSFFCYSSERKTK